MSQMIALEIQLYTDPDTGLALGNGLVYVGVAGTDPTVLANQIPITLRQENGNEVATAQPVTLGGGGIPEYQGSPAQIMTAASDYATAVHDQNGVQKYYVGTVLINAAVAESAANAALTAADVVTTNADVVLTNADVVLTNADVVLTNADVVQTNADVAFIQATGGTLIDEQIFTSSGIWTRPVAATKVDVTCVGGGGSGGGITADAVPRVGGGGGGGTYAHSFITSGLGVTEDITVGAGASGTDGAAGSTGGNSSFGVHVQADGGDGGGLGDGSVSDYRDGSTGTGGNSGTGDLIIEGGDGGAGYVVGSSFITYGEGGITQLCSGSKHDGEYSATTNGSRVSFSGLEYGGGGTGAKGGSGTGSSWKGGDGAPGIVIVKSYS